MLGHTPPTANLSVQGEGVRVTEQSSPTLSIWGSLSFCSLEIMVLQNILEDLVRLRAKCGCSSLWKAE